MRIRNITIHGFRGFNEKRTIDFDDRLTLISASNSYGKTSISEALEWLLYGSTSKFDKAPFREEYKGSYRNRHLPESLTPYVGVVFADSTSEIEFFGVLNRDDSITRYVKWKEVEKWPLEIDPSLAPKPFILQHALKYLLLVKPDERFQGFARLLGFEKLNQIQRDVSSLSTKPEASFPPEVNEFLRRASEVETRLSNQPSLAAISKAFKRGLEGLEETYRIIASECRKRMSSETEEIECVQQEMVRFRDEKVSKIFEGRLVLPEFSEDEKKNNTEDGKYLLNFVSEKFVQEYVEIVKLATVEHIFQRAKFFELGIKLTDRYKMKCPFCGQALNEPLLGHIEKEHDAVTTEVERHEQLEAKRKEISESLSNLRLRLESCQNRHILKGTQLLELESSRDQLEKILLPSHKTHVDSVRNAFSKLRDSCKKMNESYDGVLTALNDVEASVKNSKEDASLARMLGETLVEYVADAEAYAQTVSTNAPLVSEAEKALKQELDKLAGTEDLSILIDLLEKRNHVRKYFEINNVVNRLKSLRKCVEQYVSKTMLEAISGALSADVMKWYEQIKTSGVV